MFYFKSPAVTAETLEQMKDIDSYYVEVSFGYPSSYKDNKQVVQIDYMNKVFKTDGEMDFYEYDYYTVDFVKNYIPLYIARLTNPVFNTKDKTVSYYESKDKLYRNIRTESKIGKFIRKCAPFYNDNQIGFIVDVILDYYSCPEYTYKVVTSADDFASVYKNKPEKGRNINTFSCINASCMRDKFGSGPHPVKVYGSGDFELHYLVNDKNEIAARTILCTLDNVYANVYVSNQLAGNFLVEKLKEAYPDATYHHDLDSYAWIGAKLLKIETRDGLLAPYIDVQQNVSDCGDHLEISENGSDYEFSSQFGYVTKVCHCCDCGDSADEPVEVDGDTYCRGCVNYCDHTDTWTREDVIQVRYGIRYYQYGNWCQDAVDSDATYDEETGEYFENDYYKTVLAKREGKEKDDSEVTSVALPVGKVAGVFNAGDVVRIIANTNCSCNEIGDIGILDQYGRVLVKGRYDDITTDCYTLTTEMEHYTFKVGDRVKVVEECYANGNHYPVGTVCNITSFSDDSTFIRVNGDCVGNWPKMFEVVLTDVS